MQASQLPSKIPLPFANSGTKNTIPTASQVGVTPGAASLTDGFPPLTMTPLSAGGVPPSGADFNGILNLVTAVQQWQCAGGIFKYDSAFATSIGGYPKGAILQSSDGMSNWLNLADNNTTNPDSGGANWISLSAGRLLNVQVLATSGTYTPTPGTKKIIVEAVGAGGGGGGVAATSSGQASAGGGGGSGAFARVLITSVPASVAVTVGAPGAGGSGASNGGTGGTTSFGSFVSVGGGTGGAAVAGTTFPVAAPMGPGSTTISTSAVAAILDQSQGNPGTWGLVFAASGQALGGAGGASVFGGGGNPQGSGAGGQSPIGSGAGASSGCLSVAGPANTGGTGAAGLIIVYEYA